jgi:DNA-binding CsgD family transcriptional regulator
MPDDLRRCFGLTTAETDIALRLFDGQTLREIASDKGVGIATVRAQLAQVFAKTGTDRQLSLVICLARLVLKHGSSALPESRGKTASFNGKQLDFASS